MPRLGALLLLPLLAIALAAQAPAAPDLAGTWNATMQIGAQTSHFQLAIVRNAQGELAAYYIGVDSQKQVTFSVSGKSVEFHFSMEADAPDVEFHGTLNDAGDQIAGSMSMGPQYSYPTTLVKKAASGGRPGAVER